ncbi:MAG: gliding motility-associated C-terminal domain-containing protein [Bacteroidota bacterium]
MTIQDTIAAGLSPDSRKWPAGAKHRPSLHFALPAGANAALTANNPRKYTVTGAISLSIAEVDSYCGSYNGSVLVTASGGTPPYTYSFDGAAFQSSALYVTDGPFSHSVTVKDATGLTASSTVFVGNNGYGPIVNATAYTQPSGCDAADATLTVQATGGTPPYTYSMDMQNWQTTPFTGISYGWYYVWAKDANGCISNALWWPWGGCLSEGGSWGGSTCGNNSSLDITVNDYSDPSITFMYSLDGVNWKNTGNFTGLGPGKVVLHVKDSKGKNYLFSYYILEGCQLTAKATVTDATCGNNDGQLTASASYGIAPYEYSIDGLHFQSDPTFTGLAPGNYTVWVHDLTGTLQWVSAVVGNGCPTVTAIAVDAFCGNNDGTITATGQGGTAPYRYSIDGINFQTGNVFSPLAPSTYTITVMDAGGFKATTTAVVGNSCLKVTGTPGNTVCGNNNGTITATGLGGMPPYSYSIDGVNFQTAPLFTGLTAMNYTLTIRDQNGTKASSPVTITNTPGPAMTIDIHKSDCNNLGGSLTLHPTGGTPPYEYSLDGINYQSGNVFNVSSGPYTPHVRDANGCLFFQSLWVLVACLHLDVTGVNTSCGKNDGRISATASGGTPPYQYSIDGTNFQTSPLFGSLAPGNYMVTAKDADGLSNTAPMTLAGICITGLVSAVDASCGKNNGTITVTASGGSAPYHYSLDGTLFQDNTIFQNLAPGNYTITVKDDKGYTGTVPAKLLNIAGPDIVASVTSASCRDNDGGVQITGSGGTMPYVYSLDGGTYGNSGSFTGQPSGDHRTFIMDARGCSASGQTTIPLNNTVTADAGGDVTICEGKSARLMAVSNGSSFSWTPSTGLDKSSALQPNASPVTTTTYYLTASSGVCQKTVPVTVNVNPAPIANAGRDDTICFGQSSQLHGSGSDYYSWSPALYLNDPNSSAPTVNEPPGTTTYYLSVTDSKGCQSLKPSSVTISVTPPPHISIGNDTSVLAGQPVYMEVIDINNSGFVHYEWTPTSGLDNAGSPSPVASPLATTTYTVLAATSAGCQATGSRSIKVFGVAGIFVPNAFTPNGDGHNDVLKAIPVGIREFKYFAIFNRWGQRIFFTANPAVGWDGNTGGHSGTSATFVWMAGGIDYQGALIERKGTVLVVK